MNRVCLVILLWGSIAGKANAQYSPETYPNEIYTQEKYASKIDSLRKLCGHRKKIPQEFELQTLLAISHYPDLYRARIQFIYRKKVQLPIAARPAMGFLDLFFRFRKGRQYKIVMRTNTPYMLNRTFDEQVGIIGHELAHIQFYRHCSSVGLFRVGFCYLTSRRYRWRFELDTDQRAIDFGFGHQLLRFPIYMYSRDIKAYMKTKGFLK
ncbi:hypothetical protein [Microscilla marina]|uniref:hypothetical protein n=1 Tax=Microscilla marina TaxID=1027 RepID=UPI0005D47260|nr:hypothetical protein [Microscilla marina]